MEKNQELPVKQKSLKLNAFFNALRNIFALLVPLITFPYSTRVLTPEGIGQVNFAQSILQYFSLISGLGIGVYAVREGAKIRDDKIQFSKFAKEILIINLISTFSAYILLIIAIIFIPNLQNYKNLLYVCSISMIFITIGMDWIFIVKEDFGFITLRTLIAQLISTVLLFILVKSKDDVINYAFLQILGYIIISITNFNTINKTLKIKTTEKIEIKKHLKPIFSLFSISAISCIYTILDTTMLGFITTDTIVGYYAASTKINRIVLNSILSIFAILQPRLSYNIENDKENFYPLVKKGLNLLFILIIPCTLGLNLLAEPLLLVFTGDNYRDAILTTQIINPIIIFISISSFISNQVFIPLNKEKYSIICVSIGALTNMFFNAILIPKYAQNGAALASIIAEFLVMIIEFIIIAKHVVDKPFFKNLFTVLTSSILMYLIDYLVYHQLQSNIQKIIICTILGVILYASILYIFRNQYLISIIGILKSKLKK